MKEIEEKMFNIEGKITILLLPCDPNDGRDCMLEIRAGTGGSGCSWPSSMILRLKSV